MQETKAFNQSLKSVVEYAADSDMITSDEFEKKFLTPSRDEFFEHMYIAWAHEEELRRAILNFRNSFLFIGEQGSGKSSLCLSIQRYIEQFRVNETLMFRHDVRTYGGKTALRDADPKDVPDILLATLHSRLLAEYFPNTYPSADEDSGNVSGNLRLRMFAYLIDSNEKKPPNFALENEVFRAQNLYRQWYKNRNGQNNQQNGEPPYSVYDFLYEQHAVHDELTRELEKIAGELKVSHLLHILHVVHKFKRQYIWIDNIDTLAPDQQVIIEKISSRIQSHTTDFANLIVSVRDRNVLKLFDFDEVDAPPYETSVHFGDTHRETRSFFLPDAKFNHYKQIVNARMRFAYANLNHQIQKICDNPEFSHDDREYFLGQLICEVSEETYKTIFSLSNAILSIFQSAVIWSYANNSIRLLLKLHQEFLADLLTNEIYQKMIFDQTIDTHWKRPRHFSRKLLTLFLFWTHSNRHDGLQIQTYDLLSDREKWIKSRKYKPNFILDYMIIVYIWNLTLNSPRGKQHEIPRVGEIIKKLSALGYIGNTIRERIYSLFSNHQARTHILEIQTSKPDEIQSPDDILDNLPISVTPRGKVFISWIANTYGYLSVCVLNAHSRKMNLQKTPSTLREIWSKYVYADGNLNGIFSDLCIIAEMQLFMLERARCSDSYCNHDDWYASYLDDFGLPPTHKTRRYGRSNRYRMQFGAILETIRPYVRHFDSQKKLDILSNVFFGEVNKLIQQEESQVLQEEVTIEELVNIALQR